MTNYPPTWEYYKQHLCLRRAILLRNSLPQAWQYTPGCSICFASMWSTTLQFLTLEYVHSVQRHIVPILASFELINATRSTSLDINIAKNKTFCFQTNLWKRYLQKKPRPKYFLGKNNKGSKEIRQLLFRSLKLVVDTFEHSTW